MAKNDKGPAAASDETAAVQKPVGFPGGAQPPLTPDEASAGEKTVTMVFPKAMRLTRDDHRVITFRDGPQQVPVTLKDHWYLKANGVTLYEPTKQDDTAG